MGKDTQDSSISDTKIAARLGVAAEIFASVIVSTKDVLEAGFGKPTSYFDGEKKNVLMIANTLFNSCVQPSDIARLADEMSISSEVDVSDAIEPMEVECGGRATTDSDCFSEGSCSGDC